LNIVRFVGLSWLLKLILDVLPVEIKLKDPIVVLKQNSAAAAANTAKFTNSFATFVTHEKPYTRLKHSSLVWPPQHR